MLQSNSNTSGISKIAPPKQRMKAALEGLRTKSWTKTDHRRKDQAARPRQRLKSNGLRQPRDCLMRFRLYQCR